MCLVSLNQQYNCEIQLLNVGEVNYQSVLYCLSIYEFSQPTIINSRITSNSEFHFK